jgi:hypothetical protein
MTSNEAKKAILREHRYSYDEHEGVIHLEWHNLQSRLGLPADVIDEMLLALVDEGYLEPLGARFYDLTARGLAITTLSEELERQFPD